MRKRIFFGVVGAGLAFLALAVPAVAQSFLDPGPQPGIPMAGVQAADPNGPREVVIQFLGLAPEQVTAWDGLLAARRAAVEPLQQVLQATEKELQALLQGNNPDPAAVGKLVLKAKELREQIGAAHKAYVDGFEAMLTAEQKNKLAFLRRAGRAEPLFPAFRLFGLLPPPGL